MPDTTIPGLTALLEHRSWVQDLARRLVRDAAEAEDLAQEAWVRVLRSPPDPDRDPRPWLRRVLENLASNRWRGARRRTARESEWRDRRPQRTPAELVEEADQHQRLVRRVLDLEEPFKTTLVLRFYEGLSPREIAERLDIAEGTVHSRVARAVERLRDRLDEETGGDRKQWIAALLPLARLDLSAPTAAATATTLTGALVMITKSKLALLTALALVAVVVGGVWIAAATDGAVPDAESESITLVRTEPTLEGRRGALRPEATPTAGSRGPAPTDVVVFTGRVVDSRGASIPGVELFVLPPGATGIHADQLGSSQVALVRTDAEGAFRIEPDRAAGRLVAFAAGRLPASVSLEERVPGEPLELILDDARSITVRIEDPDGRWPAGCGLYVETDPDRTWDRAADPRDVLHFGGFDPEPTARATEQTYRAPTLAPLHVYPNLPRGWASVPRSLDLPVGVDEAAFRLVPSGQLRLRVVADATGEAPPDPESVAVTITDLDAQSMAWNYASPFTELEVRSRLSPGRYRVDVTVSGHLPASETFEVRSVGESSDLVVRVEPRHGGDIGRVRLRVIDPEPASDAIRALARSGAPAGFPDQYVVLLRKVDETVWHHATCSTLPDGRLELRPLLQEIRQAGLRPGSYDVYVARRDTGTAAFLPGIRVFGDHDNEIAVTLRPGSMFRVTDVVPSGKTLADIAVRAAGQGSLPLLNWRRDGHRVSTAAPHVASLLELPLQPYVLGPFPAAEVEVRLATTDGERQIARVRGATIMR